MEKQYYPLEFPRAGIDRLKGFGAQSPREMPDGSMAPTTVNGVNVRGYEPLSQRGRGGSRPGLSKYIATPLVADWIVQQLDTITFINPGGGVQTSQSGRVCTLVAVSQGNVYSCPSGGTSWTVATNNTSVTPPLNYTGIVYSTALNQKLWFADGVNYCYFDPSANTVYPWQATAGSLPVDSRGNTPRLICAWRGSIVLAGLIYDPQNWFKSALGDPTDWDYAPAEITPTQAIAGNNSPVGIVGDVITTLIPYSDDVLIFGGDHTIYQMSGEPMAGGQIDRISDTVGMAWGMPWAKDPFGTIYFVSNQMGIYTMVPGKQPQRISQPIEQLLQDYDTGTTTIRALWNDRYQGMHFFFSPTAAPASTTHLFYEARTGAWWKDQFANTNHDPLCCCLFDGNTADDRAALIGSWDGYVRQVDPNASTDDSTNIASEVWLGPLNTANLDQLNLKYIQAVLGTGSGDVTWAVHTGATAEAAFASTAALTGTWEASRNLNDLVRRSGHAIYIKLTSTSQWAIEQIRCELEGKGRVAMRGR